MKDHDTAAAKAFSQELLSPEAKAVYAKYGFTVMK